MASKIDKIIFMQDSEKSQTGKTNVLCSDKRIFVKDKTPLTILNSYNQISILNLNIFLVFSHVSVFSVGSFPTHTC